VEPFVHTLRKANPRTPIVLVEDRDYAHAFLVSGARQHNLDNREALRKAYNRLVAEGVVGLHYLPGDKLLGDDGEATVDGSHPTDLGFLRQAEALQTVIGPLLNSSTKEK